MDLDFQGALDDGAAADYGAAALQLDGFQAEGPTVTAERLQPEGTKAAPETTALPPEEQAKRKRRLEAWEQEKESSKRWDLQRRLAEISGEVELLTREVSRLRNELHVPLPPLSALPGAERAALDYARSQRQAEVVGTYCKRTLAAIMAHKWSWPFNHPVDLTMYPDYLLTVKEPIDFGTIKRKLDGGQYAHADEFLADVRMMFDNARAYNKPGADVHVMANTLQEKFEDKYMSVAARRVEEEAAISAREEEAVRRRYAGAAAAAGGAAQEAAEARCAELVKYLDEVATRAADAKSAAAAMCTPLSRAEKEALCATLMRLPQQHFEAAVGVVMHHHPGLQPFDDVAFDLGMLDALTLRQLQSFAAAAERAEEERRSGGGGKAGSAQVAWPALPVGTGTRPHKPSKKRPAGEVVLPAGEAGASAHVTPAALSLGLPAASAEAVQGLRGGAAGFAQSGNVVQPLKPAPEAYRRPASAERKQWRQQQPKQKKPRQQQQQQVQVQVVGGAERPKQCCNCHTTVTPLWRKERATGQPLCNACGIRLQIRAVN